MPEKKMKELIEKARELMGDDELAEALAYAIENQRGNLGFLLGMLKEERPSIFNPYLLKGMTVYMNPKALDVKTAELVAVGASAALRCEHCLEAHMSRSVEEGASMDEVMDAILVAGSITESSTYSVAFRKFKQLKGKMEKENKKSDKSST